MTHLASTLIREGLARLSDEGGQTAVIREEPSTPDPDAPNV
jgi:hypothetical protein